MLPFMKRRKIHFDMLNPGMKSTSLYPASCTLTLLLHPSVSSCIHMHVHKDILLSCSYSLEERLKKNTNRKVHVHKHKQSWAHMAASSVTTG